MTQRLDLKPCRAGEVRVLSRCEQQIGDIRLVSAKGHTRSLFARGNRYLPRLTSSLVADGLDDEASFIVSLKLDRKLGFCTRYSVYRQSLDLRGYQSTLSSEMRMSSEVQMVFHLCSAVLRQIMTNWHRHSIRTFVFKTLNQAGR